MHKLGFWGFSSFVFTRKGAYHKSSQQNRRMKICENKHHVNNYLTLMWKILRLYSSVLNKNTSNNVNIVSKGGKGAN